MKSIVKIISTRQRQNHHGKSFYLSEVILSDQESYSLASSKIPKVGDEMESWFDDRWQKPVAKYPIDNTVKQSKIGNKE